jgi:phenylacetate-CoA ligase
MGRSGDAIKVRGMFLHPNQLGQVMGRFSEVARYQAVITRPAQRDEFTLRVELADPSADQDALAAALTEAIPPVCRVKPDSVDFIPPGTIPEDAKQVVDERTWE